LLELRTIEGPPDFPPDELTVVVAVRMLATMGPRGVGVASGRRGALRASVFVLAALACSIEQPVSGPVALTGEWTTVTPPEPLRIGRNEQQKFCLQVVGTMSDVDFEKDRVLVDGQWHVLGGEAVDNEQAKYALKVAEQGGYALCLYRAGEPIPGPNFPADRTIVGLRLRSEPPLQVGEIRWHSYDQH
jgi:hypothetical protein